MIYTDRNFSQLQEVIVHGIWESPSTGGYLLGRNQYSGHKYQSTSLSSDDQVKCERYKHNVFDYQTLAYRLILMIVTKLSSLISVHTAIVSAQITFPLGYF